MFVKIKSGVKDKRDIKEIREDSMTICWLLLLSLLCPFCLLIYDFLPLLACYLQLGEALVHNNLIDYGLNHDIHLRILRVVGRAYMVYAVVADKLVEHHALTLLLGIVDSDGVTSKVLHKLHAGDICRTVAEVYHA